jgi:hypothetical protein
MLRLALYLTLDCSQVIVEKKWMQFKLDFAAAHREFCLTNQTAQQSGFNIANMMIEQGSGDTIQGTVDATAQLATSTASDRRMIVTLTTTNDKLASQLKEAQAYFKNIKDDILALKANIKPVWQGQRPAKSMNNNKCFWPHGYQVHKDHTSATCKAARQGRTDTRRQRPRTTPWEELHGEINDSEGQLRL